MHSARQQGLKQCGSRIQPLLLHGNLGLQHAKRSLKGTASAARHTAWRRVSPPQAAATAASTPAAQQPASRQQAHDVVEYEVAGSTISVAWKGGRQQLQQQQQQLLRLQEQSHDSEYVLLLPAAPLSGVLLEVLQRAVQCVESGNQGRPLELHHTVLHGSRTFKCSLVFSPPSQGSSNSAELGHHQSHLVTVTVQEVGRSCVHLPVTRESLQAIQQLLALLQCAAGQQQQQQLPAAMSSAAPAFSLGGMPAPAAAAATAPQNMPASAASAATDDGHAGSSSGADAGSAAVSMQSEEEKGREGKQEEDAILMQPQTARSDNGHAVPSAAADDDEDDVPAAAMQDAIDPKGSAAETAAAAAAPAAAGRSSLVAPEIVSAAIEDSTSIKDGFKFAHAAAAEALDSSSDDGVGSSSSSSSAGAAGRVFQLPHLCLLWEKLPMYAAGLQREVLQLGPDVEDADILDHAPLYPEAQQELQALVQVLVPVLQPQLPQLPRHMLQRLLQAASHASVQLPGSFLSAWAAAAVATPSTGQGSTSTSTSCWQPDGLAALLDVSLMLIDVQEGPQHTQQQQQQKPVILPLQWCAYALAQASTAVMQAQPQLLSGLFGDNGDPTAAGAAATEGVAEADEQQETVRVLQELLPLLLAAAGHHLQQEQLLWQQPWGSQGGSSHSAAASTAECQASIAASLRQLFAADSRCTHAALSAVEQGLIPGVQQQFVLQGVLMLLPQQQAAAVALVWSWLACGGGAQHINSSLLRQLLEQLPYDTAPADFASAAADAAAASSSSSSEHAGLLACVLTEHAKRGSRSDSSDSSGACADQMQLEAAGRILAFALQTDVRAAFTSLPSILSILPVGCQGNANSTSTSSTSSSSKQWDSAVGDLCNSLGHMLQLGPQQLLSHSPVALSAVASLSTARHATCESVLTVLQLAQQLSYAVDSWHVAASAPQLQQQVQDEDQAGQAHVPTAADICNCCTAFAPAFAGVFLQQSAGQQQQQLLPRLAEVLQTAAALHRTYSCHSSLAPAWLAQATTSAATESQHQTDSDSSNTTSSSSSVTARSWAAFEPVVIAAAESCGDTALDAADTAAVVAALLELGVQPSEQLLQVYLSSVGPEALGLTAEGLQQLLWTAAALVNQQEQQEKQQLQQHQGSGPATTPQLLRLATKACSSLAVRSASALTARQAARATWALANLTRCNAAAGAGWTPPQQIISWLRRVWRGLGVSSSTSSSSFGANADGVVLGLQQKVEQLQEQHMLHPQEASELLWSMQQVGLLPSMQQQVKQQQEQKQQQAQPEAIQQQQQQQQESRPSLPTSDVTPQATAASSAALDQQSSADQTAADSDQQPQQQQQQQQQTASRSQQQPHPLLQQQQLLKQRQQNSTQPSSRHTVHTFGGGMRPAKAAQGKATAVTGAVAAAARPAAVFTPPAEPARAAGVGEPEAADAGTQPAPPNAAVEAPAAEEAAAVEMQPQDAVSSAPNAAAAPPAAADASAGEAGGPVLMHGENLEGVAAAADGADSHGQAAASDDAQDTTMPAATAAVDVDVDVPAAVTAVLEQLQQPGFSPTQKQALQVLLPVQQHLAALPVQQVLAYMASCFKFKVPLTSTALLVAAKAAIAEAAAAAAAATAGGAETEPGLLSTGLALQLLSSVADAITSRPADANELQAVKHLQQQARGILQQLLPALLGPQQLAGVSAAALLQLLRDVFTLSTGHSPPKAAALPVGTTLFGPTLLRNDASNSQAGPVTAGVDQAWLSAAAAALQPKLLLLPHGSQLLQSLQLLQALGHQQPSSSFMSSFLAAADALLDTLSGRNCLELLAAVAAAEQLSSKALTTALLQQLLPQASQSSSGSIAGARLQAAAAATAASGGQQLSGRALAEALEQGQQKLLAADASAGCRLLAALGIRPSAELLLHWFSITEAAAEQMQPQEVLQVLWACCVWQLQPPSTWLGAVLKGLLPAGRLTTCSAATLAGLCRCLWLLGVQPAPGFVAAVVAAAEHSITSSAQGQTSSDSSSARQQSSWQYWQAGTQGSQEQGQQGQREGASFDAESLSVLCFCLLMWQHSGTPTWHAAVAAHATSVIPLADGPTVVRLGLYLVALQEQQAEADSFAEDLQPWQQALLTALPQLLPSAEQAAGQEVVLTAGGTAAARLIPAWALVVLSNVLAPLPAASLPVLQGLAAAVKASADQELLTAWDVTSLLSTHIELLELLQQYAEAAEGPLAALKLRQLQGEMGTVLSAAGDLLKYAYQQRAGAPADAMAAIPVLAAEFGIDMPQQSRSILVAAEAAARQGEEQLQHALLLQEQGGLGPAVPEPLLQGLAELQPDDSAQVIARYAASPLQAAFWRRVQWLGGAVSDAWVSKGLQ